MAYADNPKMRASTLRYKQSAKGKATIARYLERARNARAVLRTERERIKNSLEGGLMEGVDYSHMNIFTPDIGFKTWH